MVPLQLIGTFKCISKHERNGVDNDFTILPRCYGSMIIDRHKKIKY